MFEVDVNGLIQQYRSKPVMNVDITGSSGDSTGSSGGGSMKNLNVVVFSRGSSSSMPDSCNVPYDELRGWIENGVPVFAVYKLIDDHGSVSVLMNIMQFVLDIDSLSVYYQNRDRTDFFKYKPDGTFSVSSGVES